MSEFNSAIIYLCCFFMTIWNIKRVVGEKKHGRLYKKAVNHGEILWVLLAACPFIFVYGLRYQVGKDYMNYLNYYNHIRSSGEVKLFSYFEPGYVIINFLAAFIFHEGYGLFLMVGIFLMLLLYKLIQQYKNDVSVTFMLYIFYMVYFGVTCNVVRQMIAVIICVYTYYYALNRKLRTFLIGILIAALFHKSALFCVLLYFLTYIRKSGGVFFSK